MAGPHLRRITPVARRSVSPLLDCPAPTRSPVPTLRRSLISPSRALANGRASPTKNYASRAAERFTASGLPGPDPIPGPDVEAVPDLAEQSFGEWQGLTYEELRQSRGGAFHRFWHAPAHERAPGGESFVDMMQRVARAIHRVLDAHRGRDIIAVAHGGTIRSALGLALDLEPEACLAFTMENCSITRIDHIDGPGMGPGWRVVTVNRPPR